MAELVLMIRDPDTNNPPFSCEVDPAEVDNYRAGNWVLVSEANFNTESDLKVAAAVTAMAGATALFNALTDEEKSVADTQFRALQNPEPDAPPATTETAKQLKARLASEAKLAAELANAKPEPTAEELAAAETEAARVAALTPEQLAAEAAAKKAALDWAGS